MVAMAVANSEIPPESGTDATADPSTPLRLTALGRKSPVEVMKLGRLYRSSTHCFWFRASSRQLVGECAINSVALGGIRAKPLVHWLSTPQVQATAFRRIQPGAADFQLNAAHSAGSSAVNAEQQGFSEAWKFISSSRMPSGSYRLN